MGQYVSCYTEKSSEIREDFKPSGWTSNFDVAPLPILADLLPIHVLP